MGGEVDLSGMQGRTMPHDIVAITLVECEMAEAVGQARKMIAIAGEDPLVVASLQSGQQDLQHLVRSPEALEIAQQIVTLRRPRRIKSSAELEVDRQPAFAPRAMIAHRNREDEYTRPLGVEHSQYVVGKLRVRAIGWPPRTSEALDAEKALEAQRRKCQIAPEKAAVERVQANGTIALAAQAPGERRNRRARESMIGIEPVIAELAFGDSSQHRELCPHCVCAPARHFEPAERRAALATGVKSR